MLELEHGFRVVDVHARLRAEATGTTEAERLQREMRQAGVVRAVVSPSSRSRSYVEANNAVARASVERPFLAFARISGARKPGGSPRTRLHNVATSRKEHHTSPENVEGYAYDDRFHGFALDPAADGLPDEAVIDRLDRVERPVLVRGGRAFPPGDVERTLLGRSFPVVLAHFGGHPLDRDAMAEAVDLLDRYDGLYLDTSAVRYRSVLERALREHPGRVLFGSGAPDVHPDVAVMEVLTLDVPEDTMRRVFSENAVRVVPELGR
jgi:predicted TIM-barrel fold metal-dependent hydrolase